MNLTPQQIDAIAAKRNAAELFGVSESSPPRCQWVSDYKVSAAATSVGELIKLDLLPAFPFLKIYGVVRFTASSGYEFRGELNLSLRGQPLIKLPVEIGDNLSLAAGTHTISVLQRSVTGTTFGTDYIMVAADTVQPSACIPKKVLAVADRAVLNVKKASGLGSVYSVVIAIEQSTHPFP